jgi:TRAP-type uncharacterized transport system substrate-binding protein
MSEPESKSVGSICRVEIFTPQGELIKKIKSDNRIYRYTEVINPKTLDPGAYHEVIQSQKMIFVDSLLVTYSAQNEKK